MTVEIIPFRITGLYAGVLALIYMLMAINVMINRYKFKVGIGDGEQRPLAKAIRIHGNFAEYIPFILVLMAIYELNGGDSTLLHGCGIALAVGRVLHAIGISKSIGVTLYRQIGMLTAFIALVMLAVINIIHFF